MLTPDSSQTLATSLRSGRVDVWSDVPDGDEESADPPEIPAGRQLLIDTVFTDTRVCSITRTSVHYARLACDAFFDVIEMLSHDSLERLELYANGGFTDDPQPGFWTAQVLTRRNS